MTDVATATARERRRQPDGTTPVRLGVARHPDDNVTRHGVTVDGAFLEMCWASAIGPTATLIARHCIHARDGQLPAEVRAGDLAAMCGVSNTKLRAALLRLGQFRLADVDVEDDTWTCVLWQHLPGLQHQALQRGGPLVQQTQRRLLTSGEAEFGTR